MAETNVVLRTEVRGFNLGLSGSTLALTADGTPLLSLIVLDSGDADRLRLEMAKTQLWEWNQIEELKSRAEKRYRSFLGSWLVLCLAAFSAYIGYPSYYLPLFLTALSIFMWWRVGHEEHKAERAAQAERNRFIADWSYFQRRVEESESPSA